LNASNRRAAASISSYEALEAFNRSISPEPCTVTSISNMVAKRA
jgi:hypothetical protein